MKAERKSEGTRALRIPPKKRRFLIIIYTRQGNVNCEDGGKTSEAESERSIYSRVTACFDQFSRGGMSRFFFLFFFFFNLDRNSPILFSGLVSTVRLIIGDIDNILLSAK